VVESATVTTVSGATERIAEEMARELLRDETSRAELQDLVRKHFSSTMQTLAKNGRRRGAR
jgi:hypothetical protein